MCVGVCVCVCVLLWGGPPHPVQEYHTLTALRCMLLPGGSRVEGGRGRGEGGGTRDSRDGNFVTTDNEIMAHTKAGMRRRTWSAGANIFPLLSLSSSS